MRALYALPVLAALALVPALMEEAEAQSRETYTIRLTMGASQENPAEVNPFRFGSRERNANNILECTTQFPSYFYSENRFNTVNQFFLGGLTSFSSYPSSNTKCHAYNAVNLVTHARLENSAPNITGARLVYDRYNTVDPKTCQILVTNLPIQNPSNVLTYANQRAYWQDQANLAVYRQHVTDVINADTYIPERHLVFDHNFCLGASGFEQILTFDTSLPVMDTILYGLQSPGPLEATPENPVRTLVFTLAQNNATTEQISYSQMALRYMEFNMTLDVIDTAFTFIGPDSETYRSEEHNLSTGECGTFGDVGYEDKVQGPLISKGYFGNSDFRNRCTTAVFHMDNVFAPGTDFEAITLNLFLNTLDPNIVDGTCDVLIYNDTPTDQQAFNSFWNRHWTTVGDAALLVDNSTTCYTPNSQGVSSFELDAAARDRFQQLIDASQDSDTFRIFAGPNGATWTNTDAGRTYLPYLDVAALAVTHTDLAPKPITVLNASGTSPTSITLEWQPPARAAAAYSEYQIFRVDTSGGMTRDIMVGSAPLTSNTFEVPNLSVNIPYTFKVSAVNNLGIANLGPNAATATAYTQTNVRPGSIAPPSSAAPNATAVLNPVTVSMQQFQAQNYSLVTLNWAQNVNLTCTYDLKFSREKGNVTLNPMAQGNRFIDTIQVNGTQHDIFTMYCTDPALNIDIRHVVPQTQFEFLDQLNNFTDGTYGTFGQIGTLDLITASMVLVSFLAFNRVQPILGIVTALAILTFAAWMEIIIMEVATLTGVTLTVFFAIISFRNRR